MKWTTRAAFVLLMLITTGALIRMLNEPNTWAVAGGALGFVVMAFIAVKGWRAAAHLGIILVALSFTGCSKVVSGGYVGVKIKMTGTDKGVNEIPIQTGRVFYNPWTEDIFVYPTFMQTAKWEGDKSISFNSKEGMQLGAPMALAFNLDATKVPAFYVQFRNDDLENFTQGYLRNVAKDAFNAEAVNYTVEQIYSDKKEELLTKVKARVNAQVAKYGVQIDQFGITKALELPPAIVQSMELKIKATQDAITIENQLRASKAEAEKAVAQAEGAARVQVAQYEGQAKATLVQAEANAKARIMEAEAEAKRNKLINDSLTDRLLALRQLDIQSNTAQKWDGRLPQQQIPGSALPFINLPTNK